MEMCRVIENLRADAETKADKALLNLMLLSQDYLPREVPSAEKFISLLRNESITPNLLVDSAMAYLADDSAVFASCFVADEPVSTPANGQESAIDPAVAKVGAEAEIGNGAQTGSDDLFS